MKPRLSVTHSLTIFSLGRSVVNRAVNRKSVIAHFSQWEFEVEVLYLTVSLLPFSCSLYGNASTFWGVDFATNLSNYNKSSLVTQPCHWAATHPDL